MEAFYKLRYLTLLSLFCYANLSLALGLGDAVLKSNLGEKFLARVNVTDIESLPDSICFSAADVGESPAFKSPFLNIKAINGNYQLTITTNEVITEPIVNLRISFNCEPNVNREYVLLLDPAPITIEEKVITNLDNDSSLSRVTPAKKQTRNSSSSKFRLTSTPEETLENSSEGTPVSRVLRDKKSKKHRIVDEKLKESYVGKDINNPSSQSNSNPETGIQAESKNIPTAHKPFLVISAGRTISDGEQRRGLSLRLATEIDLTRQDEIPESQSATDTLDEVTVMSNRLAHLEKQINSLQLRNAELVREVKKDKASERFDWVKFLPIILGILLAIAIFELMRRKLVIKESPIKDSWFEDENSDDAENMVGSNLADEFNNANVSLGTSVNSKLNELSSQSRNSFTAHVMTNAEKEEHGSIIEDADVFIEHGRPALAIQLLQNYLSDSPAESPTIWIKLLQLIAKEGSKSEYDETVRDCHRHFNIKTPGFDDDYSLDYSTIEDYPEIVTRLEGVWGSPYAVGFLKDLIFNKRSQPREGLEPGAFNDLFFLQNIAKSLDYDNSNMFQNSSILTESNQTNHIQTLIVNTKDLIIENTNFDDELFSDDTLTKAQLEMDAEFNDLQDKDEASFDSFTEPTSYEVKIIAHDQTPPAFNSTEKGLAFGGTPKVELLNAEIVYDDTENALTDENAQLDFYIEFPNETETTPTKNQSASNEIEWDLSKEPELVPVVKPKPDK